MAYADLIKEKHPELFGGSSSDEAPVAPPRSTAPSSEVTAEVAPVRGASLANLGELVGLSDVQPDGRRRSTGAKVDLSGLRNALNFSGGGGTNPTQDVSSPARQNSFDDGSMSLAMGGNSGGMSEVGYENSFDNGSMNSAMNNEGGDGGGSYIGAAIGAGLGWETGRRHNNRWAEERKARGEADPDGFGSNDASGTGHGEDYRSRIGDATLGGFAGYFGGGYGAAVANMIMQNPKVAEAQDKGSRWLLDQGDKIDGAYGAEKIDPIGAWASGKYEHRDLGKSAAFGPAGKYISGGGIKRFFKKIF